MLRIDKSKLLPIFTHIIGWGVVFSFPFFFGWKGENTITWEKYLGYVFFPIALMIVFYVNYFILIGKLLFKKKIFYFLLLNVLMFIVLSFCLNKWHDYYFTNFAEQALGEKFHKRPQPPLLMIMMRDGIIMVLVAALSVAIRMTGNWFLVQSEKKELEKARSEAELQNLKNQLNPHFLFNTLNNIYSLIAIDPDRAQYAVHDLSRLLRHVLYEDNQRFVTLDHELAFMKSYIELMSLRLSDNVKLKVEIPENGGNVVIAPLLFISLIENAFKHGVSPVEASYIYINFTIKEHEVECRIENSCFPKKENDHSGSGIGLENLHKRLSILYPDKYKLDIRNANGRYIVELKLTV